MTQPRCLAVAWREPSRHKLVRPQSISPFVRPRVAVAAIRRQTLLSLTSVAILCGVARLEKLISDSAKPTKTHSPGARSNRCVSANRSGHVLSREYGRLCSLPQPRRGVLGLRRPGYIRSTSGLAGGRDVSLAGFWNLQTSETGERETGKKPISIL